MRIDHVEISIPRGTLTDEYCRDLDQLLTGILGWRGQELRARFVRYLVLRWIDIQSRDATS